MADNGSGNGALPEGRVVRVIGPVVDAEFPPDGIPEIDTALVVDRTLGGETSSITCEVGGTPSSSSSEIFSMWSSTCESSRDMRSTSSSDSASRANRATCSTSARSIIGGEV